MDKYIKIRDEYIENLRRLGHRHLIISDLKSYMRKVGYSKRCLWCGGTLRGRQQKWCCDEHADKFYNQYLWEFLRSNCLEKNPMCQMCGEKKSKEVHHKEPIKLLAKFKIRGDPWDGDNLIALCRKCHVEAHKNLRKKYANLIIRRKMKSPGLEAFGLECLPKDMPPDSPGGEDKPIEIKEEEEK